MPGLSNTLGTAYISVNKEGKFHQLRQYRDDRTPRFDIDYGIDAPLTGSDGAIHIHEYDGEEKRLEGRWLSRAEYKRYRKYFREVE